MGGFDVTWYEITIAVAGAFGGLELLKWGVNIIFNRKNNARIADSEADASEFGVLQTTNVFLQQQLKEKEERFAEQTNLLRKVQRELLELEKEKSVMEVEYLKRIAALELELMMKRCDEHDCPFRQPPTAHTPPAKGLTKDKHFAKKRAKEITETKE